MGSVDSHLEIGSIVLGDIWTVALRQHHDLLLDVLDLILSLLKINDFNSNHLLGSVVDALEHLTETTLADPLLLGEYQLRIYLLQQTGERQLVM